MDDEIDRCVNDPRYRGRAWDDVEPEMKKQWTSDHGDRPWDEVAFAMRDLWERA